MLLPDLEVPPFFFFAISEILRKLRQSQLWRQILFGATVRDATLSYGLVAGS